MLWSALSHVGGATSVEYSANGSLLVSSGYVNRRKQDLTKLWNAKTGLLLQTIPSRSVARSMEFTVTGSCFSTDGKILALVGLEKNMKSQLINSSFQIWKKGGGGSFFFAYNGALTLTGWAKEVLLSPDNHILIICHVDGALEAWDVSKRKLAWQNNVIAPGGSLLIMRNPQKTLIAPASVKLDPYRKSGIGYYELSTGRLRKFQHNPEKINTQALAITPDDKVLAQLTGQGTIQFWDIQQGSLIRSISHKFNDDPKAFCFSQDGRHLLFNTKSLSK